MKVRNNVSRNLAIKILVVVIILLIIYYCCSLFFRGKNTIEGLDGESIGFIMTRHVKDANTNKIWINSLKKIRQFYPNETVVIIDDNSNYEYIVFDEEILKNCIVINSEYKSRGELLPYYYFYLNKWFDTAIYIHDSVFVNSKIPINNQNKIKFLYEFSDTPGSSNEMKEAEKLIQHLNYNNELDTLLKTPDKWKGCWGAMAAINHDYLIYLADKYNLFVLLEYIDSRVKRMAFERIVGLICCHDNPSLVENASVYGNYLTISSTINGLDDYLEKDKNGEINTGITKLFFGR